MHQTCTWMCGRKIRFAIASGLGIGLVGCASTSHVDLLEARLREQEVLVERYEREIADVREELLTAQRRSVLLEEQLAEGGSRLVSAEVTDQLAAVEGIRFNTLLTGAQNLDSVPGDERLHAMIYPHDSDGGIVKLVGSVTLEAIDLSRPEGQRTLGRWEFDPQQALEIWHAGFISSGFKFEFPWQSQPTSNEVLLHATFRTPDGREFRNSHTIRITPPKLLATVNESPALATPPEERAFPAVPNSNTPPPMPTPSFPPQTRDSRPRALQDLSQEPAPSAELVAKQEPSSGAGFVAISYEEESPAPTGPGAKTNATQPMPFPSGIVTSDNFREETIPAYR